MYSRKCRPNHISEALHVEQPQQAHYEQHQLKDRITSHFEELQYYDTIPLVYSHMFDSRMAMNAHLA